MSIGSYLVSSADCRRALGGGPVRRGQTWEPARAALHPPRRSRSSGFGGGAGPVSRRDRAGRLPIARLHRRGDARIRSGRDAGRPAAGARTRSTGGAGPCSSTPCSRAGGRRTWTSTSSCGGDVAGKAPGGIAIVPATQGSMAHRPARSPPADGLMAPAYWRFIP